MEKARDGKKYQRDIVPDVFNFAERGITLIVCLLNDFEIRSIGAEAKLYEPACEKKGVELFKHPIIEMAPPKDLSQWNQEVVLKVINHIA